MSSASQVVTLSGVSKRYFRKPGIRSVAAELLRREAPGAVWALRDVDLAVRRGERLGIVGANGAGKTTLLRVLSGVVTPTHGQRLAVGRVLALSEMQACLHRELTGRENIPLLATLAGLSRREVDTRLADVLRFSGLPAEALDTPVKNYSNGMATRLAISVAATGQADLIVVDEGIAGGDVLFRRHCFDRLRELALRGCAIVLASHDTAEVRMHAERCLYLHKGRVVAEGATDEVLAGYQMEQWGDTTPSRELLLGVIYGGHRSSAGRAGGGQPTGDRQKLLRSSCNTKLPRPSTVSFSGSRSSPPTERGSISSDHRRRGRLEPGRRPRRGRTTCSSHRSCAWCVHGKHRGLGPVAQPPSTRPARAGVRDRRRARREVGSGASSGARVDEALDSRTTGPGTSLAARALYRVARAIVDQCQWLDEVAYRLLARRYAKRPQGGGERSAIHFFVGSLGSGGRPTSARDPRPLSRGPRLSLQDLGTGQARLVDADVEDAGATWDWRRRHHAAVRAGNYSSRSGGSSAIGPTLGRRWRSRPPTTRTAGRVAVPSRYQQRWRSLGWTNGRRARGGGRASEPSPSRAWLSGHSLPPALLSSAGRRPRRRGRRQLREWTRQLSPMATGDASTKVRVVRNGLDPLP